MVIYSSFTPIKSSVERLSRVVFMLQNDKYDAVETSFGGCLFYSECGPAVTNTATARTICSAQLKYYWTRTRGKNSI